MAIISLHTLAFVFGLLGNIVSFMVFLAPLPTFYRIYKSKSTQGFHSVPYVVALFMSTLQLYYGFLKPNGIMLITINSIGCIIEAAYLIMYIVYAPKSVKILTAKIIVLFNVGLYGFIIVITMIFTKVSLRLTVVGWISAAFNVSVFASPLSITRQVIRTKSVEYMPFSLSLFLTLSAVMWFMYGFFIKDFYIAIPNILGLAFGIAQMALYLLYKNSKKEVLDLIQQQMTNDMKFNTVENPKQQQSDHQSEHTQMNPSVNVVGKPMEGNECNV